MQAKRQKFNKYKENRNIYSTISSKSYLVLPLKNEINSKGTTELEGMKPTYIIK